MGNRSKEVTSVKCKDEKEKRGMLPIFYCSDWDVWCLLDTGSNGTELGKGVWKRIQP